LDPAGDDRVVDKIKPPAGPGIDPLVIDSQAKTPGV